VRDVQLIGMWDLCSSPMHRALRLWRGEIVDRLLAKEMNSKYKETSEGGLAVSLVLASSQRRGASSAKQA